MYRVAVAVLCLCLSCFAQDSAQKTMQHALEAQQAGRFEEAIRDYRSLLQQYPNIAEVRSNLGAALAGQGQYKEAIAEYQQALALRPNPQVRLNLALAYYKTGDFQLAASTLKRVHAEDSGNMQAVTLLSDCYLRLGQNKDVIALLTPVQQAQPDNKAFIYLLGTALVRDGQAGKGQVIIDNILRNGDSAESRLLMGTSKYMEGDHAGAYEDFRRTVELNPKLPDAYAYYGISLLSMGDQAGARRAFERELELDPNNFVSNLQMSVLLRKSHDDAGALNCLHRALRMRPDDSGVRFEIASIELAQGQLTQATHDLESLVKDSPNFIEAHWSLARAYFLENRKADGKREREISGKLRTANQAKDKGTVAAKSAQ